MSGIRMFNNVEFYWVAAGVQRALARVQYLQNLQGAGSISAGFVLFSDALEEVLTFAPQRFIPGNIHCLAIISVRNRQTVNPVNTMRVQHQFPLTLHVIKDRHFLAADNRELLFLKGVQPAYENVDIDAAGKLTRAQSG